MITNWIAYFWLIAICSIVLLEMFMKLPSEGLRMYEKWSFESYEKEFDVAAIYGKLVSFQIDVVNASKYAQKLVELRAPGSIIDWNNVTKQELEIIGISEQVAENILSKFKHSIYALNDLNGNFYLGEVDDKGRKSGKGKINYSSKSTSGESLLSYCGYFINNKRNGFGTAFYSDGSKFIGEWKDDKKNGKGIMIDSNGTILTLFGKWKEDSLILNKYISFLNRRYYGKVIFIHADGCKYEGQWKNGMMNGKGTYYNPDGTIFYIGEWKDDLMNGKGVSFYEHGIKQYEGDWKHGLANGKGIMYRDDGSKQYEGDLVDSIPNGEG